MREILKKNKLDEVDGERDSQSGYNPSSLWWLIYDSLKYTKFEELKKVIGQAHKIMSNHSEEVRRVQIEQFLLSIKKNGEKTGKDYTGNNYSNEIKAGDETFKLKHAKTISKQQP